jgi:ABC-type transporter Mla maintaining outer membrane lipid asymmetry ATPase subunit MlaF
MPDVIRVDNIACVRGDVELFCGVSFGVGRGSSLIISGPSGSGKSSLLEICAGLAQPAAGVVRWFGRPTSGLSRAEMLSFRKASGYVFQRHALISSMTVEQNIALPLRYHYGIDNHDVADRCKKQCAAFGIEPVARRRPEELSHAQSRLAALARALILEPDVLFLDEPTAGLDPVTANMVVRKIINYQKARAASVIMVCHTIHIIRQMRCPVAVLDGNTLRLTGTEAISEVDVSAYGGAIHE